MLPFCFGVKRRNHMRPLRKTIKVFVLVLCAAVLLSGCSYRITITRDPSASLTGDGKVEDSPQTRKVLWKKIRHSGDGESEVLICYEDFNEAFLPMSYTEYPDSDEPKHFSVEYDEKDRPIKEEELNAQGQVSRYWIYEYDASGALLKKTEYYSSGEPFSWIEYESSNGCILAEREYYVRDGHLSSETFYEYADGDASEDELCGESYYVYKHEHDQQSLRYETHLVYSRGSDGRIEESYWASIGDNPSYPSYLWPYDKIRKKMAYDDDGDLIRELIYDIQDPDAYYSTDPMWYVGLDETAWIHRGRWIEYVYIDAVPDFGQP